MIFFAWINNNTNPEYDEVLKMQAKSIEKAREYAEFWVSQRKDCCIGSIFSLTEFKRIHPDWYILLRKTKADIVK